MLPSLHSQSLYEYSTDSGSSLYAQNINPLSFSSSVGIPAGPPLNADPNSPDLFNQNVKLAIQYVQVISRLARTALEGIEQAFDPASQSNPMTAAADISSVRHYLGLFTEFLTQSGVGALPLLAMPPDGSAPTPSEESALLAQTANAVTALYARQKQVQENNAVVASLLVVPESSRR
ncbi:hypothetical protein DFH11DRAFT_1512492 [Phellopilus nigrolimitatus]|nr:hypothetical protein DFH11DRAFT_1512492 [Phellopilus nigrolimitatus]